MKTHLKKNKALFILPLVLLPFVLLIFYILGGGQKQEKEERLAKEQVEKQGANYLLPEAEKNIEIYDKMEAYEKQNISIPIGKNSPLIDDDSLHVEIPNENADLETDRIAALYEKSASEDVSSQLLAHIRKKEALHRKDVEQEEQEAVQPQKIINKQRTKFVKTKDPERKEENDLELLIKNQESGFEELEQAFDENIALNQENDSLKYVLEQSQQFLLELKEKRQKSFSLEKKEDFSFNKTKTSYSLIKAEIYESTKVLDGNRIKMRLLEDAWLNGIKAPQNTFFYGTCKIQNERLHIQVSYFPMENYFFPVDLQIHDLDGQLGLYIPDNVARRVSKEVGGRTSASSLWGRGNDPLSNIGISAVDQTSQSLLKRVRIRKVHIKKNSLVYLINKK